MKEFISLLFHFRFKQLLVLPTQNTFVQFFRFIFVGGIATVVDVLAVTFSYEMLGFKNLDLPRFDFDVGLLLAGTIGFVLGLAVNYFISIIWVFRNQNLNRVKEFLSFAVIGVFGLVIKLIVMVLLERYVFDISVFLFGVIPMVTVVSMIATLVAFVWNFVARKFILYSTKGVERLQK